MFEKSIFLLFKIRFPISYCSEFLILLVVLEFCFDDTNRFLIVFSFMHFIFHLPLNEQIVFLLIIVFYYRYLRFGPISSLYNKLYLFYLFSLSNYLWIYSGLFLHHLQYLLPL